LIIAKPVICLVTPGTRDANNGNWRTAARWSRMLRDRYRIIVQTAWSGGRADAMVALHAKRSAESVAAFHSTGRPVAVVLSGTDLYRDLPGGGETARSLDLAARIVALQEDALAHLSPSWRAKCGVIHQSAPAIAHRAVKDGWLRCAVVGHLRAEKDPLTILAAVQALPKDLRLRVRHIGAALDPELGRAARALARRDDRYRYIGALPHGLARAAIASSDLLLHPSRMEGGANVIVEAVTSDTPVIASRVSGNVGMLGSDYPGYFEAGDAAGLAGTLERCASERGFIARLRARARSRRPLFRPEAEARAIHGLVATLLV